MKAITRTLRKVRVPLMAFGLFTLLFAVFTAGANLDAVLTETGHHAIFVIAGLLLGYGFGSIPHDND